MKEIREDVREYIMRQVSESLARLGVFEPMCELKPREDEYHDRVEYTYESEPIRHTPMLFKELRAKAHMVMLEPKKGGKYFDLTEKHDIICLIIEYKWTSFRNGHNGCDLGRMIFAVEKELPEDFKDKFGYHADLYINKIEGLNI